jgi:DNA-binding IclR family transcriptional regulator
MSVGGRFPAYVSAAGQVLLASQANVSAASIVRHGVRAYTRRTLTARAELERRLAQVRRQGYAVSEGEHREDIGGFGAPVRDVTGAVVGALGIIIPMSRFPSGARATRSVQALVDASNRLSRDLGYRAAEVRREPRATTAKRRAASRARAAG